MDLVVHYGAQVDLIVLPRRRGEAGDNPGSALEDVGDRIGIQDEARHRITRRVEARGELGQLGGTRGIPPTTLALSRLASPPTRPGRPEDADSPAGVAPGRARRPLFYDPFCGPAC